MPNFPAPLPLTLYIHIPWCVRKCPYCDFNSHAQNGELPESAYVGSLLSELDDYCTRKMLRDRQIISLFFGGGTPSLFSEEAIEKIINGVRERFMLSPDVEITLEANPGTVDMARFKGFKTAGINRLSIGVQSLQDAKLRTLGRIHNKACAVNAISAVKDAGFDNFNIDLMYGLPQQTLADALFDLQSALAFNPTHLSWYQLTIEPNTFFAHHPPQLPNDDAAWEMQMAGFALLNEAGLQQYEVSAFASDKRYCRHNLNYWEFGDYLGIGAGAHSKITDHENNRVLRFASVKHPRDYLQAEKRALSKEKEIGEADLIFEFMLNALRLTHGFDLELFTQRTSLKVAVIMPLLNKALAHGFVVMDDDHVVTTTLGKRFLNNLMMLFLP